MYEHSVFAHAPDSNFLEYNNVLETGKLKVDSGILMEGKNEIMFDMGNESLERDIDLLRTEKQNGNGFRKLPGLHDLMDVEGSINGTGNETGDYTNPFIDPLYDDKLSQKETELYTDLADNEDSINGKRNKTEDYTNPFIDPLCDVKLSQKEADLYTDKSVTECELPELIVCFKEGPYNGGIKDICIDEGLPSVDKVLIENLEVHDKGHFAYFNSDMVVSNKLTKEVKQNTSPVSDGTSHSIDCQNETDGESEKGEGNFTARDETLNLVSNEVKLENKFLVQECNKSMQEPCNTDGDEVQQQSNQVEESNSNSPQEPCNIDGDKGQRQSDQDTWEEGQPTNSLAPSVPKKESNNCNQASELPLKSETESGTITLDVDSLPAPTTSSQEEENTQKKDVQQPLQALMRLGLEEDLQDSKTASSRSFITQQGYGESSFSSVGPPSGPISYSEAIPYSGSISLRSDSSTTSARSFAFPVLNTEWNSSPVKMVKADRRHFRKHRGWKLCFLCCRF